MAQVLRGEKKGAVELSMTTIIIVVIGITILTLGLRWVYKIFGDLGTSTDELQRLTQDQIISILGGSTEAINLPTSVVSGIERGDTYNLKVVMRNTYSEAHSFRYAVSVQDTPGTIPAEVVLGKLTWFKEEISDLDSGDGFQDFVSINTQDLPIGQYNLRLTLYCMDCSPPSEKSVPVIFSVV